MSSVRLAQFIRPFAVLAAFVLWPQLPVAQAPPITTPKAALGFDIGDDYQLANYTKLSAYWRTLDRESDRFTVVEYGKTSEGRPMLMSIVTSPANQKNLARYRDISKRLSLAEGLDDAQARALAAEGKAVVWIDAGLHATEVANAQALTEFVYQMVSRDDVETRRLLDDVILLAAFSNPDGLELVADWYMREPDPMKRTTGGLPVLYQKYIGHDNNRESLLMNMPEAESIGRVLYREWFPQIVYNQHQSGPAGTILYIGQMRDPSNPFLDPLMAPSMELVSAAIHSRFVVEGKGGAVNRSFASYQNWWNGGVRSTACFHNQIGILSEISGNPTPMEIAFIPRNLVANNDNPLPVHPQRLHFRQTIEYLLTANRAILDIASKRREDFLFNIYRMGRNGIDKGSRDTWTITAKRVAEVGQALERDKVTAGRGGVPIKYYDLLRDPARRDARAYIVPADQPDFPTATKFVNALIKNGVTVHRATAPFEAGTRSYPAGSYIVRTAQAFRPHVLDNFEPQDYPDDFAYPGGPPIRPYDVTGYTLAFQMGVQFDRVIDALDGPFERIEGFARPAVGAITGAPRAAGYLLSPEANDAFIAVNRLLKAGERVSRLTGALQTGGGTYPPGTFYVASRGSTAAALDAIARDRGLGFEAVARAPQVPAELLATRRIGVVDVYGGSMPSGWVQWLLTQFEFPFEVVYPPDLDAGNLHSRFDVLVFENGLVPEAGRGGGRGGGGRGGPDPARVPAEYRNRIGAVTAETTIPQLRLFVESGGTIVAIGSSSAALASHFELPVNSALVDGSTGRPLTAEQFYVPGSVLRVKVDPAQPLAWGLAEDVDMFYSNNPLFHLNEGAGVRRVAWFAAEDPVRSGWTWGVPHLKDAVAVAEADLGKGKVSLFGPLIAFRAHPHGTFKFLFNALCGAGDRR